MAGTTVFAVESIVLVIFPMARDAFRIEFLFKLVLGVTIRTADLTVLIQQCERRFHSMIELRVRPGAGRMTERAVGPVQAIMRIVIAMARIAVRWCININVVNMAGGTLHLQMPS